jgi:hypothetical protein
MSQLCQLLGRGTEHIDCFFNDGFSRLHATRPFKNIAHDAKPLVHIRSAADRQAFDVFRDAEIDIAECLDVSRQQKIYDVLRRRLLYCVSDHQFDILRTGAERSVECRKQVVLQNRDTGIDAKH